MNPPNPAAAAGSSNLWSTLLHDPRRASICIFLLAAAFYGVNVNYQANGDTFFYANLIDAREFHDHVLHQGYYAVGMAIHGTTSALGLPFTTVETLTWLNVFATALYLVIAWHLAAHFLEDQRLRWVTVGTMVLCGRVYSNTVLAEIYALQTLFVLAAWLAFMERRYWLTGFIYLLAMWVSPLSAFFSLFFPAIAFTRRLGLWPLIQAAIPVVVGYGMVFMYFFGEELLWGSRGLLVIRGKSPPVPLDGFVAFLQFQFKHYTVLCLLFLVALVRVVRNWEFFVVAVITALPNAYILSSLRSEDNTFILALDVLFALAITLGVAELLQRRLAWLVGVLFAVHAGLFLWAHQPFVSETNADFEANAREMAERLREEDTFVATDWDNQVAITYAGRSAPRVPFQGGPLFSRTLDRYDIDRLEPNVLDGYPMIYVVEPWYATPLARLFLSEQELSDRYQRQAIKARFERKFNRSCEAAPDVPLKNSYRCRRNR